MYNAKIYVNTRPKGQERVTTVKLEPPVIRNKKIEVSLKTKVKAPKFISCIPFLSYGR